MCSRLVFAAAAAPLALHAVVDAFVAPEPGTAAGDHLVAGLVQVAAVGAALAVYPRLRTGSGAVLAIALGVLAVAGAGLAVVEARQIGLRGEHWTAFLLGPAGAALLALGAIRLWRSRKPGGRRAVRRTLLAFAAAVGIYVVLAPLAMSLGATHRPRADVARLDLVRPYVEVTLRTRDGLELAAWYVPSRNGAAVISFPTRRGKPEHARMLARHGYGVLVVDMRGYDDSDGVSNAFGWGATRDIDAAAAWLAARPEVDDDRIGGIGFSVGGELMLEAAADNELLRAVVSEGAGQRSVREALLYGPRGWLAVPPAAVQTAAVAILGGVTPPPALDDLVARIAPRSVFLIHAGRGTGGEELNADYFAAAREPKQLWLIPEAHHVGGLQARPREYERRVVGFFDRALPRGEPQLLSICARCSLPE